MIIDWSLVPSVLGVILGVAVLLTGVMWAGVALVKLFWKKFGD